MTLPDDTQQTTKNRNLNRSSLISRAHSVAVHKFSKGANCWRGTETHATSSLIAVSRFCQK
jgi:hypothetical protein